MENNCIGFKFPCGCRYPVERFANRKKSNGTTPGIVCPIHGVKWTHKVYKCIECGMYAETKSIAGAQRCKLCQADHYGFLRREYNRQLQLEKNRVFKLRAKGAPVSKPRVKRLIDQTRRGICAHGIDCVNNQLKNGIEFNCNGCQRFKRLELDIMDYISTTDTRWAEKRQEKWRR